MFAEPGDDCTDPFEGGHCQTRLTSISRTSSHPIQNRTSGFTASGRILPFPHRGYVVFLCGTALNIPWASESVCVGSWVSACQLGLVSHGSKRCVQLFSLLICDPPHPLLSASQARLRGSVIDRQKVPRYQ